MSSGPIHLKFKIIFVWKATVNVPQDEWIMLLPISVLHCYFWLQIWWIDSSCDSFSMDPHTIWKLIFLIIIITVPIHFDSDKVTKLHPCYNIFLILNLIPALCIPIMSRRQRRNKQQVEETLEKIKEELTALFTQNKGTGMNHTQIFR